MDVDGFGHITLFGRFQKGYHDFCGSVSVTMAAVTGIRLFVNTPCLQTGLGEHESECMAVRVSGLTNARHSGHVTAYTAAKGMNPMDRPVLGRCMAAFAELVFEQSGFGTDDDQGIGHLSHRLQSALAAVDIVARNAGHTHLGVFALFPVEILLVAVFGFP
jgi:hypothetical protein